MEDLEEIERELGGRSAGSIAVKAKHSEVGGACLPSAQGQEQMNAALTEDVAFNLAFMYATGGPMDGHTRKILEVFLARHEDEATITLKQCVQQMTEECFADQSETWREGFKHYAARMLVEASRQDSEGQNVERGQ